MDLNLRTLERDPTPEGQVKYLKALNRIGRITDSQLLVLSYAKYQPAIEITNITGFTILGRGLNYPDILFRAVQSTDDGKELAKLLVVEAAFALITAPEVTIRCLETHCSYYSDLFYQCPIYEAHSQAFCSDRKAIAYRVLKSLRDPKYPFPSQDPVDEIPFTPAWLWAIRQGKYKEAMDRLKVLGGFYCSGEGWPLTQAMRKAVISRILPP